ncbi:hypothetical protein AJ87_21345 [Rhizobium yanglingense]|nr:hypothetical protein AJ87_21345 [Rhizobium yanglingense]
MAALADVTISSQVVGALATILLLKRNGSMPIVKKMRYTPPTALLSEVMLSTISALFLVQASVPLSSSAQPFIPQRPPMRSSANMISIPEYCV